MPSFRTALVVVLAAACLLPPALARADKCSGAKLKTSGSALSGTLKCDSNAEAKGTAGQSASCDAKMDEKLTKEFGKPDAKAAGHGNASAGLELLEPCESRVIWAGGRTENPTPAET